MLNRYKAAPKTTAGKVGYAVLCILSLLILAALAVLPFVMLLLVYGDPWWEMIFLAYPLMIPGYWEILALLDALHYLVRRKTGTVSPSRWGDRLRMMYGILGAQCGWIFLRLFFANTSDLVLKRRLDALSDFGTDVYLWAGLLIGCLWLADLIRKAVEKQRKKREAAAAEQRDWDEFAGRP